MNSKGDASGLQSARAGRASRAGARAGRIVRIVRMVRLVRLVKLYKYLQTNREGEQTSGGGTGNQGSVTKSLTKQGTNKNMQDSNADLSKISKESRLGSAMSDLTTRRVIILVLAMLLIIPLLTFSNNDSSMQFGLDVSHTFLVKNVTNSSYMPAIDTSLSLLHQRTDLVELILDGERTVLKGGRMNKLRDVELLTISIQTDSIASVSTPSYTTEGTFDVENISVDSSIYSIILTWFVILLLVAGTFLFAQDVNRLVIVPIERMVDVVEKISKNPLEIRDVNEMDDDFEQGMETTLLLQTINKVAGLMRIGFGMAGADMIAQNLQQSTNNQLDLLTSGNMIQSIFGFCDIRNFTDTTECLQEEVMLFVNRIAHILHGVMAQCEGAANKNIGDAFLLTWKLDEGAGPEQLSALADQALLCFVRSLIEFKRRNEFVCNFSVSASQKLYKRMPGYRVRMGFGLHLGWAVEGALGSFRKIDATYISPHVNMSEFLEGSTKTYGFFEVKYQFIFGFLIVFLL